MIRVGSLHPVP